MGFMDTVGVRSHPSRGTVVLPHCGTGLRQMGAPVWHGRYARTFLLEARRGQRPCASDRENAGLIPDIVTLLP